MSNSETAALDNQMPCGNCPGGTYAVETIIGGVNMFGACPDRRSALRAAPRCKLNGSKICMGCRDFIVSSQFPLDHAMIKSLCRE